MRLSSSVVLLSLAAQAFACVGCLRREDDGPVLKEIGDRHVGEYQLNTEEPIAGVYGHPRGARQQPAKGAEIHWAKPRLILAEDRTFRFVSFPPRWLPALAQPEDKVLEVSGKWRVGSDPERGVFEFLDVESVNGRPASQTLHLWLGETPMLYTPDGKKIARFARVRPEGNPQEVQGQP